ncbi:MAG: D-alanine--D-alanine ligase [Planctomycetota bacterium]|nr:MAG: D-alanine--D-alanine ligase [Planctomycetota bacterium]
MIQKVNEDLLVAVLHGGISSERNVSIDSGLSVFEALKKKYKNTNLIDVKSDFGTSKDHFKYDVYYNVLHGEFGEDGQVQKILEKEGKAYTGSDIKSCQLTMDKIATKKLLISKEIPTADFLELEKNKIYSPEEIINSVSMPLVLKPSNGGSSIFMKMVYELDDFNGIELTYPLFAESFVDGREFTVSVFEGNALPVIEIVPEGDFYDFEAKYKSNKTQYQFDTISEDKQLELQNLAESVYEITGSRDAVRVDFMIDKNDNVFVLELNSIPGMTSHSLLPKAAQKVGISFDDLCQKILELAIIRRK